jgi:XTP/dITP diphosphohydrolase
MTKLLIASGNAGKVREYAELFAALNYQTVGLRDLDLHTMTVDEPYDTFEENAIHKARAYAAAAGIWTLADDSGLMVDALGGRPGVLTARYAGDGASDRDRYMKLLGELATVPEDERTARFVCVIALAAADGTTEYVRGECTGRIALAPGMGAHGFGFDPVFIPEGYDVTFDQLPPEQKHAISHRGRAMQLILPILARRLEM